MVFFSVALEHLKRAKGKQEEKTYGSTFCPAVIKDPWPILTFSLLVP
jgi:hypothetical protein